MGFKSRLWPPRGLVILSEPVRIEGDGLEIPPQVRREHLRHDSFLCWPDLVPSGLPFLPQASSRG